MVTRNDALIAFLVTWQKNTLGGEPTNMGVYLYFDSFYKEFWIPRFSMSSLETIQKYILLHIIIVLGRTCQHGFYPYFYSFYNEY
jgi:hypothetical protein